VTPILTERQSTLKENNSVFPIHLVTRIAAPVLHGGFATCFSWRRYGKIVFE
jgi:hypothetical protein